MLFDFIHTVKANNIFIDSEIDFFEAPSSWKRKTQNMFLFTCNSIIWSIVIRFLINIIDFCINHCKYNKIINNLRLLRFLLLKKFDKDYLEKNRRIFERNYKITNNCTLCNIISRWLEIMTVNTNNDDVFTKLWSKFEI